MSNNNIVFFIDKKQYKTDVTETTAKDLLIDFAKEDPVETTLVLKVGNDITKYEDNNQAITLENGMHFAVFHDGPTTVSLYGPDQLVDELKELGYEPELVKPKENLYVVIRNYEIDLGKFAGSVIDLGIPATPNFPQSVGSSIHVRAEPQLYEKTDTLPNVRNIIDSELGNEWRYWSKNFNWSQKNQTARRLMAQIAGVFKDA